MKIVLKPGGLLVVVLALLVLGGVAFSRRGAGTSPTSPTASDAAPPVNLAQNPDMSAKDAGNSGLPGGWGRSWWEGKPPIFRRDESESRSAPASLLLEMQHKSLSGQVKQRIMVQPGERYRISGYIKTANATGKWSLAVQYDDKDEKVMNFIHIGSLQPSTEWQLRESVVTVPVGAAGMGIAFFANGEGKGWLDDVSVTREP